MKKIILITFLGIVFNLSNTLAQINYDETNNFIDSVRNVWEVPGVAIAVVKDGEIIYSGGCGTKELGKDDPVNTETLFCLGSSTKAFTSFAAGLLVDEGVLDWRKPISDYIPWFRLKDENASQNVDVLDLLTHRSGLPKHPLCREIQPGSKKEFVKRVGYLNNSGGLRERWQYSNINYIIVTCIIEEITGKSWNEYYKENIFEPLEMSRTYCNVAGAIEDGNIAKPYLEKDTVIEKMGYYHDSILSGAGTIYSNVDDMANWLIMHLNKGIYNENQLMNQRTISSMHIPHSATPWPVSYPELFYNSYGLGWFVTSYRGHLHIHHGGVLMGYSAMVSFMPEYNAGVVVLANLNGTKLTDIIEKYVYDNIMEEEIIDWSSRFISYNKRVEDYYKDYDPYKYQQKNTEPSHSIGEYCGKYFNDAYGEVELTKDGDDLSLSFEGGVCVVEHYHYDIFEFMDAVIYMGGKLSFITDVETGEVVGFEMIMSKSGDGKVIFNKE